MYLLPWLCSCCGHRHAHSCDRSRNHQTCLPAERAAFSSGHKLRCGRPRRAKGSDSTSDLPRFIFVKQPRHGKRMFPLDPASSVREASAIIVTPSCRCTEGSNGATSLAKRPQERLSTGSASDQTEARDSTHWAAGKNSCKHLKQDHSPTATSPGCLAHQHLLQNK